MVVLVVWVLCSPLVLPAMAVLIRAEQWWPWSRWYLSRDRDAVLAIRARRGQWRIAEHVCSRPGTGQGRALRDVLLPALSPVAIEEGLTITMNAASPRLAKTYLELLPGLRDVGPAFPRGRRLRLDPQEERRTS
ncbi:MAG: hypothetical protein Q4G34_01015 [Micrococcus sp.]|nr:hypothetical protein [Micrococcus sp.]